MKQGCALSILLAKPDTQAGLLHWRVCLPPSNMVSGHDDFITGGIL
jgi:hypothetical protein